MFEMKDYFVLFKHGSAFTTSSGLKFALNAQTASQCKTVIFGRILCKSCFYIYFRSLNWQV